MIEEGNLEVYTTSQTKLKTKQRLTILTLLEHCHVYLFDVL